MAGSEITKSVPRASARALDGPVESAGASPHALTTVGLIVTRSCPIECGMCITSSGPSERDWMSWEMIEAILEQASDIASVNHVSVTGGEPFARFPYLVKIATFAADRALGVSITTNAFWCTSEQVTRRRLMRLQSVGLRSLTVSTDLFHQEFVPIARAETALRVGEELGLSVTLNRVCQARDTATSLGMPRFGKSVRIISSNFVPAGRAADLPAAVHPPAAAYERFAGPCRDAKGSLTVDVDGSVYSCCGLLTAPFRIGKFPTVPLLELARIADADVVITALSTIGPVAVASILGTKATTAQSQCDVCLNTFGHGSVAHGDVSSLDRLRLAVASQYVDKRRSCESD